MENNAERQANTIIEMTREAVESGNEKLYWMALGYVEGMRRSGVFKDEFAKSLLACVRDERNRKKEEKRGWFRKIWDRTA